DPAYAAHTSAAAAAACPREITARSPMRSATIPQPRSVAIEPMFNAASTTPTCVSVSAKCSWIAGAIAVSPSSTAENAAWASTPAARIVQRYLRARAGVELTELANLLGVRALAVPARHLEHDRKVLKLGMSKEHAETFSDQA